MRPGRGGTPSPAARPASKLGTRAAIHDVFGVSRRGHISRARKRSGVAAYAAATPAGDGSARSMSPCTWAQAHESARLASSVSGESTVRVWRPESPPPSTTPGRAGTTTSTSHGCSRSSPAATAAGVNRHGRSAPASSTAANRFVSMSDEPGAGSTRTTCAASSATTAAGPSSSIGGPWTTSTSSPVGPLLRNRTEAVTVAVSPGARPSTASTVMLLASPVRSHGMNSGATIGALLIWPAPTSARSPRWRGASRAPRSSSSRWPG